MGSLSHFFISFLRQLPNPTIFFILFEILIVPITTKLLPLFIVITSEYQMFPISCLPSFYLIHVIFKHPKLYFVIFRELQIPLTFPNSKGILSWSNEFLFPFLFYWLEIPLKGFNFVVPSLLLKVKVPFGFRKAICCPFNWILISGHILSFNIMLMF